MHLVRVSCREDRTDSTDFAEELIIEGGPLLSKGNYIVLIHGYNNTYREAQDFYENIRNRYSEWVDWEKSPHDGIVEFYWPSSWAASIGFIPARRRAGRAARFLREFIQRSYLASGATFTLVSHSLGAEVVLPLITSDDPVDRMMIRNAVLAAPAIANNRIKKLFVQTKVLFSRRDEVLGRVYRALHWFRAALGFTGPDKPVVRMTAIDMSDSIFGHSDYQNSRKFIEEISQ